MKPMLRAGVAAGLAVAVAAITAGGSVLTVREPAPARPVDPDGRTVTVCPAAPMVNITSATTWGSLGVRSVTETDLRPVPTGRGVTLTGTQQPTMMVAEGRQNLASAASAYAKQGAGPERGIALARCGTPGTSTWLTGLVSQPDDPAGGRRSEVLLINPDAGQAEVDLVIYGPSGIQVASGARGIAVPARSVRAVALETLFTRAEPVGVEVRTNRGRVAALARQHLAAGAQPSGTDWQVAAAPPATRQIVPGVPGGPGARLLVLSNPGNRRTTASIEVLGPGGTFAPVDASTLDVNAQSTASVSLAQGLDGEAAAVRITSDQPLVASVAARSADAGPNADAAVQPAAGPVVGLGIGALAVAPGVQGTVLVSNDGDAEVTVPLRLVGVDGNQLSAIELRVPAGATAPWVLDRVEQPAAVRVQAPADSRIYAGVVLTSAADPVGGLSSAPISVPEQQQGGSIDPRHDPGAGR